MIIINRRGAPSGGGGSSNDFTSDPLSSYGTRLVDPTISSDAVGGTTATCTWNGVSGIYQVYKTVQFALNDYLTTGGRRIGLLAGTTYTLNADLTFPASGSSDSNRVVLQGDPSAAANNLPVINLNTVYGIKPDKNNTVNYLTLRKLEITGQNKISTDGNANPSAIYLGSAHDYNGFVGEYLYIHDCFADSGAYDYGGIAFGPASVTSAIARYCKFKNIGIYPSTFTNNNFAGIYVGAIYGAQIYNCEMDNTSDGGYHKVPALNADINTPNGSIWHHNVFKNCYQGVEVGNAGISGQWGYFGVQIYNNLFYNINQNAIYPEQIGSGPQCDGLIVKNNTIDTVNFGIGIAGFTGVQFLNNAIIAPTWFIYTEVTGSLLTRLSACDYNGYGGAGEYSMRSDGSRQDYADLTAWKAATSGQSAELTSIGSPDGHGMAISTSSFRDYTNHDFSPANGSGLLSAGSDGKNIGCYDGATVASSTLVGAGW